MRRGERIFVYGGLVAALVLAAGGRVPALSGAAVASGHRAAAAPESARIAVCDVYHIADLLLKSDRYTPALNEEQERLAAELMPLEQELRSMQERAEKMDPKNEETQKLAVEYQRKAQEFQRRAMEAERLFTQFVAAKYIEAYEAARASADAVAEELGYTHVIASRRADEKIETNDVQQVIQAVLARPVVKAPKTSDITDDVLKDLKL